MQRIIIGQSNMSVNKTPKKNRDQAWTNASVRALLEVVGETDPVRAITLRARSVALNAMDHGWSGPPFDPLKLADHLGIAVSPRHDVADARTIPAPGGRFLIEFNPNRPSARVRYSIAHEIAHTLFPDCGDRVRHRAFHADQRGDEWQLEATCNIGAAELLMPLGSLKSAKDSNWTMETLLALRKQYEVSMEALLIRIVRLARSPLGMFCAARLETGKDTGRFLLSYTIGSQSWQSNVGPDLLPLDTVLSEIVAIGHTTSATETWGGAHLRVQAVGIPPYPGSRSPRVVGILTPIDRTSGARADAPPLRFVRGDALKPRGSGARILVHVVNDKTPNWGGRGFAQAIRHRWPEVQTDFRQHVSHNRHALALGNVRICSLADGLSVASVVAQKGYGESVRPRIRYSALRTGLETVAIKASEMDASVHMPRIGAGQGAGTWSVIEDIIQTVFSEKNVSVTVYDLPDAPLPPKVPLQDELSFAVGS